MKQLALLFQAAQRPAIRLKSLNGPADGFWKRMGVSISRSMPGATGKEGKGCVREATPDEVLARIP